MFVSQMKQWFPLTFLFCYFYVVSLSGNWVSSQNQHAWFYNFSNKQTTMSLRVMIYKAPIPNWDFDLDAKPIMWRQRNRFYQNIHSNDVRYIPSTVRAKVNMGLQLQVLKRAYSPAMNFRSNVCTVENKVKIEQKCKPPSFRMESMSVVISNRMTGFCGWKRNNYLIQIFKLLISIRTKHD